eukprot:3474-Chlamydomonas_euryale.AAC.1
MGGARAIQTRVQFEHTQKQHEEMGRERGRKTWVGLHVTHRHPSCQREDFSPIVDNTLSDGQRRKVRLSGRTCDEQGSDGCATLTRGTVAPSVAPWHSGTVALRH